MTIIAADSEPVEPVVDVDEVILHAGERFDVEITISDSFELGSTHWIRADTLESREQGYQNGIRAILYIADPNDSDPLDPDSIHDPPTDIATTSDHNTKLTYNCYSRNEAERGGCFPVSALKVKDGAMSYASKTAAEGSAAPMEAHVIDWQFRCACFINMISTADSLVYLS